MCLTTAKTVQFLIGTNKTLYVTCLIRDNRCDGLHTLTFVHVICTLMYSGGHAIRQS